MLNGSGQSSHRVPGPERRADSLIPAICRFPKTTGGLTQDLEHETGKGSGRAWLGHSARQAEVDGAVTGHSARPTRPPRDTTPRFPVSGRETQCVRRNWTLTLRATAGAPFSPPNFTFNKTVPKQPSPAVRDDGHVNGVRHFAVWF